MANTITKTTLFNSATRRELQISILSDGTQETNTILYDPTSSPFSTAGSYVATKIRRCVTNASCAAAAKMYLTYDATTAAVAYPIPQQGWSKYDSMELGMIPMINNAGSGVTGKIGITTTGLAAGDSILINLEILNQ
jgi:hypothetical protein